MNRAIYTIILAAVLAVGCNTTQDLTEPGTATRIAIQYATLKLINQSSDVSKADVLDGVESVRALVDPEATVEVSRLTEQALQAVDIGGLDPADQLLLREILRLAERRLADQTDSGIIDPDDWVAVTAILDYVESAARLYVPDK